MGFDIHMVNEPTAIPDGMELQNPDMPGYHRFNIRAMPLTIGAMEWAECLSYDAPPVFPEMPFDDQERGFDVIDFVLHGDELEDEDFEDDDDWVKPSEEEVKLAQKHLDAVNAILTAPNKAGGLVPVYKFETNDGFWITPEECLVVADKLDEHKEMIARDFFTDAGVSYEDGLVWLTYWSNYNRLASEHGGYRVY